MFIDGRSWYDCNGEQRARGRFLILMQPEAPEPLENAPIRGLVKKVSMRPLGNFMMGRARVGKHTLALSGAYGSDGLPCCVPQEVYAKGIDVPAELIEAWNSGGGWNGPGAEAPALREWALRVFKLEGRSDFHGKSG